jgi:hypothetical protein
MNCDFVFVCGTHTRGVVVLLMAILPLQNLSNLVLVVLFL